MSIVSMSMARAPTATNEDKPIHSEKSATRSRVRRPSRITTAEPSLLSHFERRLKKSQTNRAANVEKTSVAEVISMICVFMLRVSWLDALPAAISFRQATQLV